MGDRIKRMIAAIIDWNICCLPGMDSGFLVGFVRCLNKNKE